ncbi:MAG: hypothetical protein OXC11_02420 [Rhodospirillales bacterium]|nr:hypothetical protein [Rhodospirillales bacterium]
MCQRALGGAGISVATLLSVGRVHRAAATWEARAFRFLAIGLVVLGGGLSDTQPSLAQTQDACPPPAGLPPLADPPVTAQQVENGAGSLMEFALAARERSREHAQRAATVEQGVYIACLVRQEGGPWRVGSTYIVSLTLDGRIFIHAKDMALSGRLLNRLLYSTILSSLGVSSADLANLGSPDSATRESAFAAVLATLSQEPDAPFDATVPIPGLRPGIPGASGYASVYVSPEFRSPIVLLARFDVNASHLEEEALDYGEPTITARQVVDRETLKAFVTQAGNYFSGNPRNQRSSCNLKGQDCPTGSERGLATRLRVSLRLGYGQQHHHVSRGVS